MKKVSFVIIILLSVISFSLSTDKIVLAGNNIFDYESINNIQIQINSNFEDRDFKPYISYSFDTKNMNYSYNFYINTRSINASYKDLIDEDNYTSSGNIKDLIVKYDFLTNFSKKLTEDRMVVDIYSIIRSIIY